MIQAYVVLPALLVVYLFGTSLPPRQKMVHLILALLVLAAVSLSWALAVDAIPADQRPYIGTSGDNSVIGLILGHNGEEAFLIEDTAGTYNSPDLFRFFTHGVILQISWLLPLALISLLTWWRRPENLSLAGFRKLDLFSEKGLTLLAFCLWLLPGLIYFTFTFGSWALYYLATIAPPLAGLVGIGVVSMYHEYMSERSTGWVLVVAVVVTGLMQAWLLSTFVYYDPVGYGSLYVLELAGCVGGSALLIWLRVKNLQGTNRGSFPVVCVAVAALFLAPAAWSCLPFETGSSVENMGGYNATSLTVPLAGFLLSHAGNTTFIAAVPTASLAGSLNINTGRPVMAFGGYLGTDQIISAGQIPGLIRNRTVRYILVISENRSSDYRGVGYGENNAIYTWVEGHCAAVPESEWSEKNVYFWRQYGLYDCAGVS
jgi:4-amino-4-deoxy-L-arabinose transferase-like glycosyltransferase